MNIYLAPMEGITGHLVRNAYLHHFPAIDKYFTPFIPAAKRLSAKWKRDLDPENNQGLTLIPQLISNQSREVLEMIRQLKDLGYQEFNINLGCPSGTVVSKKRGSGILQDPELLEHFLDEVYSAVDVPVSLKTRIGFSELTEWEPLLRIYEKYPMNEFIIHPRLRKELYSGLPHLDAFEKAYIFYFEASDSGTRLVYNGDLWNMNCYDEVITRFSKLDTVMIGRGLLARPDLACQIKGIALPDCKERLHAFCVEIFEGYLEIFRSEKDAVMHMKELWIHLGRRFQDGEKMTKKLLKTSSTTEYRLLVEQVFQNLELMP